MQVHIEYMICLLFHLTHTHTRTSTYIDIIHYIYNFPFTPVIFCLLRLLYSIQLPVLIPAPLSSPRADDDPSRYLRIDPKLNHDATLIAYVRQRDLWITSVEGDMRLTFCADQTADRTRSCGTVEYLMQVTHCSLHYPKPEARNEEYASLKGCRKNFIGTQATIGVLLE